MIGELHRGFSLLDQEIELLRHIDQTILDYGSNGPSHSTEALFLDSVGRFSQIHRTRTSLLCYVYLGPHFELLHHEASNPSTPLRIEISADIEPLLQPDEPHIATDLLASEPGVGLFKNFPGAKTILLCPLYSPTKRRKHLLCLFILSDREPAVGSYLNDEGLEESLVTLVRQLAIAFNHRDRALHHRRIQELWNVFLASDLSPTQCFTELALRIPSFLPIFGPLNFPGPPPHVQILMLARSIDGRPQHMVIRGTTGEEHPGTRVAINGSICGLLVEDPEHYPYYCDDPSKPEYASRYKSYLGQHGMIRTELAVPLTRGNELVGVLNLESERVNAFNIHHVDSITALSETITPMVTVFEKRLKMNAATQFSVTSSTAQYLEALASVFRHAVGTPLASLHSNIDLAKAQVTTDTKKALKEANAAAAGGKKQALSLALGKVSERLDLTDATFARLFGIHSQISEYTKVFADDIGSYAATGAMDLRSILDATAALAANSLLAKLGKNIRIEFHKDDTLPTTRVFCSMLLKQHVYSIVHNAILSIQDRLETDPSPGIISISILQDTPPSSQEVDLNESWVIRIRDNGKGVTPDELTKLKRFQPGVRFRISPGQGHGLTAVQRYISSIGGRVELASEEGIFFEVILHLDEYRPQVHDPIAIESN
jgi:signal transduction histidine kinase